MLVLHQRLQFYFDEGLTLEISALPPSSWLLVHSLGKFHYLTCLFGASFFTGTSVPPLSVNCVLYVLHCSTSSCLPTKFSSDGSRICCCRAIVAPLLIKWGQILIQKGHCKIIQNIKQRNQRNPNQLLVRSMGRCFASPFRKKDVIRFILFTLFSITVSLGAGLLKASCHLIVPITEKSNQRTHGNTTRTIIKMG